MNDDRRKAIWAKHYAKHGKQTVSNIKHITSVCQHCGGQAENSKLRGMTLCGSCKQRVWNSDTAGSNYDRFINMGISHDDAMRDSGYRL